MYYLLVNDQSKRSTSNKPTSKININKYYIINHYIYLTTHHDQLILINILTITFGIPHNYQGRLNIRILLHRGELKIAVNGGEHPFKNA